MLATPDVVSAAVAPTEIVPCTSSPSGRPVTSAAVGAIVSTPNDFVSDAMLPARSATDADTVCMPSCRSFAGTRTSAATVWAAGVPGSSVSDVDALLRPDRASLADTTIVGRGTFDHPSAAGLTSVERRRDRIERS